MYPRVISYVLEQMLTLMRQDQVILVHATLLYLVEHNLFQQIIMLPMLVQIQVKIGQTILYRYLETLLLEKIL